MHGGQHACHTWHRGESPCFYAPNTEGPISPQRLENRLRVARAERGLSQDQLAKLVGVTRQTVSSIETNQYVPSALLAFQLAKRLGKRVDELFTLTGDVP
jgi:putative transcriptional regulator